MNVKLNWLESLQVHNKAALVALYVLLLWNSYFPARTLTYQNNRKHDYVKLDGHCTNTAKVIVRRIIYRRAKLTYDNPLIVYKERRFRGSNLHESSVIKHRSNSKYPTCSRKSDCEHLHILSVTTFMVAAQKWPLAWGITERLAQFS